MKTKRLLAHFGVLVLGSLTLVVVDRLVGVKFADDVGVVAQIIHDANYMIWGGVIVGVNKWLDG